MTRGSFGDPLIACALITRDEERCIGRALESVAPHVDRMVVVDTGSVDRTREIALECGAEVHEIEWTDDFAAAKNVALARSEGDFTLVIDADEWVVAGGDRLRGWASQRGMTPAFGVVTCVSSTDATGENQYVADELIRILPAGAWFEGRVHEQPCGGFPLVHAGLQLAHDGYMEVQLASKKGRNARLLRAELLDRQDGYLWYQLGCALAVEGHHSEAAEAFEKALPRVSTDSPQRHPLVVRHLYSLGQAGRFEAAVSLFRDQVAAWPESPDLHFVMADVLLDLGGARPDRAKVIAPMIRTLLERCLEIGERPDLPGAVLGRGSTLAHRNLQLLPGLSGWNAAASPAEHAGKGE